MRALLTTRLRALGPVAAVPVAEALRSGSGAFLALLLAAVVALSSASAGFGFVLIAPFGATAVLLFAAVSSPLAQPWPVVVGNTVSALVAIVICTFVTAPLIFVPLSVAAAITAMAFARATHPPGGAVALTVALAAAEGKLPGFGFVLIPVAAGSVLLVLTATLWAWLSGRRYPMRQFGGAGPVLTADPPAAERFGLSEAELRQLLSDYRQSLNLGVEDLARLIAAAELRAAGHQTGAQTVGEIMSRDLVTVAPDASLQTVAEIFRRHGFTSLPVVSQDGALQGVIFQIHVIAAFADPGRRRLSLRLGKKRSSAADIMTVDVATASEAAPIGRLVTQLSEKGADAVMVAEDQILTGVVTQTDLIAALARELLHGALPKNG